MAAAEAAKRLHEQMAQETVESQQRLRVAEAELDAELEAEAAQREAQEGMDKEQRRQSRLKEEQRLLEDIERRRAVARARRDGERIRFQESLLAREEHEWRLRKAELEAELARELDDAREALKAEREQDSRRMRERLKVKLRRVSEETIRRFEEEVAGDEGQRLDKVELAAAAVLRGEEPEAEDVQPNGIALIEGVPEDEIRKTLHEQTAIEALAILSAAPEDLRQHLLRMFSEPMKSALAARLADEGGGPLVEGPKADGDQEAFAQFIGKLRTVKEA